jgi:hypothetical protein
MYKMHINHANPTSPINQQQHQQQQQQQQQSTSFKNSIQYNQQSSLQAQNGPVSIYYDTNSLSTLTTLTPPPSLYHYQLLKTPSPTQFQIISSADQLNFQQKQQQAFADFNNNNFLAANTNETQLYEYMQQLLEEKEKLKELYNEPFTIVLPVSAKLLDEGLLRFYSCLLFGLGFSI